MNTSLQHEQQFTFSIFQLLVLLKLMYCILIIKICKIECEDILCNYEYKQVVFHKKSAKNLTE